MRDAKRRAVMTVAAEMFLGHGAHRVSLNAIADRLGITKPALYNYFKNRDEILLACFEVSYQIASELLSSIEASTITGHAKLAAFIRGYALIVTQPFGAVMLRLDDRDLPDNKRAIVRRYKRDIDDRVRSVIVGGMKDGSLDRCDSKLTAFTILGALNWIPQWYIPSRQLSITEIGDHLAFQLLNGLVAGEPAAKALVEPRPS